MNKQEVVELVYMAILAFPGKGPKEKREIDGLISVWQMTLGDFPYLVVQAALAKTIATSVYFPVPAEILKAIQSLIPGPPTAEKAWGEVREVITSGHLSIEHQYNGWRPKWSHPLIEETVDQIGLRELFESENMGITMAQFIKFYNKNMEDDTGKNINERILRLTGLERLMLTGSEG